MKNTKFSFIPPMQCTVWWWWQWWCGKCVYWFSNDLPCFGLYDSMQTFISYCYNLVRAKARANRTFYDQVLVSSGVGRTECRHEHKSLRKCCINLILKPFYKLDHVCAGKIFNFNFLCKIMKWPKTGVKTEHIFEQISKRVSNQISEWISEPFLERISQWKFNTDIWTNF